ncbi:MAG: zinc ribbon domain-containing protein [Isosphaeraceae bacterium]|nr:zinc ribbon domain-containing protein [Isosphaeraceae bacterium]
MLAPKRSLSASTTMEVVERIIRPEMERFCPCCGGELDLHQPDIDSPHRMLGTCGHCAQWVVIETLGATSSRVLEIPKSTDEALRPSRRRLARLAGEAN